MWQRTRPDDIAPVWDEVTADVVGLLCATGGYDAALAARFLGVGRAGFVGGRLKEYLDDEQRDRIDQVSAEVFLSLQRIEEMSGEAEAADPFGLLLRLKEAPLIAY